MDSTGFGREALLRAEDSITEVKSLKIEPAGEGEAGFAKYRVTL
jgi:2',3'-cyclic-nucleotide 2'-phosphodiesterase/3'-nucleotidase